MEIFKAIASAINLIAETFAKSDKRTFLGVVLLCVMMAFVVYMIHENNQRMLFVEEMMIGLSEEQRDFYLIVGEFEKKIAIIEKDKEKLKGIKDKYDKLLSKYKKNQRATRARLRRRSDKKIKNTGRKIFKVKIPRGYKVDRDEEFNSRLEDIEAHIKNMVKYRTVTTKKDEYIYTVDPNFEVEEVTNKDKSFKTFEKVKEIEMEDILDDLSKRPMPDTYDDEESDGWELLNPYTGRH